MYSQSDLTFEDGAERQVAIWTNFRHGRPTNYPKRSALYTWRRPKSDGPCVSFCVTLEFLPPRRMPPHH